MSKVPTSQPTFQVPPSPYGTKLAGRKAIAAYWLGDPTSKGERRISALMAEVRPENRIPHGIDGDGQPYSYTRWLDEHARSRAKYLPPSVSEKDGTAA